MSKAVGVIGLGAMGIGVARNLLRNGFRVYGFDLREDACEAFSLAGGIACRTPAEVGMQSEVVIVLVINAEQTRSALFGDNGAANEMRAGSVVIASATVAPSYAVEFGEKLSKLGIGMLDCPVSGGGSAQPTGLLPC